MKSVILSLIVLMISTVLCQFSSLNPDAGSDVASQNYVIDLKVKPDLELLAVSENSGINRYYLYTRNNEDSPQELFMDDADSIINSNFTTELDTAVVVHAYLGNQNSDSSVAIRKAFLDKRPMNVIVVDWSRLSRTDYVTAAYAVPGVGRHLGQFLNFLNSVTGADFNTIHLVGFSLGAHVVGNAGKETNQKVARVTGLDPAGPLYESNPNKLSRGDAKYVEAIHTDGDPLLGFGTSSAIADVDIYPNGGKSQPGCITNFCDHIRAWKLFAASVTFNHLIGNECSSKLEITLNTCTGKEFPLGNDLLNKTGLGLYRVNTDKTYPY